MVEVFKTNVRQVKEAKLLTKKLAEHFPLYEINFDLSDCDKILRVEGSIISTGEIIEIINKNKFDCAVLE